MSSGRGRFDERRLEIQQVGTAHAQSPSHCAPARHGLGHFAPDRLRLRSIQPEIRRDGHRRATAVDDACVLGQPCLALCRSLPRAPAPPGCRPWPPVAWPALRPGSRRAGPPDWETCRPPGVYQSTGSKAGVSWSSCRSFAWARRITLSPQASGAVSSSARKNTCRGCCTPATG